MPLTRHTRNTSNNSCKAANTRRQGRHLATLALISRCPTYTLPSFYYTFLVCTAGYLGSGGRAGMSNIFPGKLSALCRGGRRPVTWWSPGQPGGSPGTPNHWAAGLMHICMHIFHLLIGSLHQMIFQGINTDDVHSTQWR